MASDQFFEEWQVKGGSEKAGISQNLFRVVFLILKLKNVIYT